MTQLEINLIVACGALLLAWLGIGVYVVISRAIYDVRLRAVHVAARIVEQRARRAPGDGANLDVRRIVRHLPPATVMHVAADTATPPKLAEALSRHVVERHGERIASLAAAQSSEGEKWRRVAALRVLAQAKPDVALPLLRNALECGDAVVVGAAVAILGSMRSEHAAAALVDALRRDLFPRSRVAAQLEDFALDVPHLVLVLVRDDEASVRYWGAKLLARYPKLPSLASDLAPLVCDPVPDVRTAALDALAAVGGAIAADAAVRLLADPVAFVRVHAARALQRSESPAVAAEVARLLPDDTWWVRSAAKRTLEAMGPVATSEVVRYLDSEDAFARNGAAEILQNTGVVDVLVQRAAAAPGDASVVRVLERVLNAGGRRFAEATLARTGASAAPALRAIVAGGARA